MTKLDDQIAQNRTDLERCPPGNTNRTHTLFNLANSLKDKFLETNDIADLDEAIALHRSALDLRPTGHPDRHSSLFQLAWGLGERHRKQGTLPDLEEAITLGRVALDLRPEGHPDRSVSDRYDKQGSVADLEEAIIFCRAALELRPSGHSDRAPTLYYLGSYLSRRFLKLGATADLDWAISLHLSALDLHPEGHPNRSDSLHFLLVYFSDRYDRQSLVTDLEQVIKLGRVALELYPSDHPRRSATLSNLADHLRRRFLKLGATADLNWAISLYLSALDLHPEGHPKRSDSLHFLAVCFSDRYDKQGSVADLEQAITLGRSALELRPPGHSDRALTVSHLADQLRRRFLKLGATADIEEAISLHLSALELRPEGHPNRSVSLRFLVVCFSDRYDKQGSVADLEQAITLGRSALELHPLGHSDRAPTLSHLADQLRRRFLKLGATADIEEAISLHLSALELRPEGHPDQPGSLHFLAVCFSDRYNKQGSAADLEQAIMFGRAALELHPLGHSDRAPILSNLADHLRRRFLKLGTNADLDEAISHYRSTLNLYPEDHPNRSGTALATCLQDRFQKHGDITDLDEAIILHKEASERFPSGSPGSAAPLQKLALCLSQRSMLPTQIDLDDATKSSPQTDLDDAIKYEKAALALYPVGRPDHVKSLSSLASYHKLRIQWRGAPPRPDHPGATANPTINNIVSDVLKDFPPRLLDASSGTLCDRGAQISHFKNSQEYKQLVSSTSALDTLSQTARMREIVSTYFQYVTLSHRWGTSEPLLRDIKDQVIYNLDPNDGLSKLQSFCLETLRHGHFWAWSDTCCIDKESSAELQEAIGSMFLWYRRSALTVVHLADVSGTYPLTKSEWFKRGWTLQELLAPRVLLFFTQDWSVYRDISSNHKEDTAILGELEQVTGIMPGQLSSFLPGVDNARAKLQWASTRCTTRPEDIAYSLFGVFDLHLPVLYGEAAEYALMRLLADVISRSGDTKILDWIGKSSKCHSCFPDSILPYHTPLQLPSLDHMALQNIQESVTSIREMHQVLSNLPRTQFANIRLYLPCIVHRVKTVQTRVDTAATHVHCIQATGLDPVEVTLSQPLENITGKPLPYVLIRPWDSKLLDVSVIDDTSARQWLTMMQQPFSALLLKQLQQNEYKRIATSCHILACPTYSNGVLKGEATTLTII